MPISENRFSSGEQKEKHTSFNDVMEQAKEAGADIIKPAQDTFWGGYAGYFQDPDDHLWEVVWNPQWKIEE